MADEVSYGLVGTARAGSTAAGGEVIAELAGHPFGGRDGLALTGTTYLIDEVRLLAPVLPSKVIGFLPSGPGPAGPGEDGRGGDFVFQLKPSTTVCGPSDAIRYPALTERLEASGELAVVIGRLCRHVPRERVGEVVLGYTCANDVTARDQQKRDGQWWRAKGFDSFCPLGPWLETQASGDLDMVTSVNGRVCQQARVPVSGPEVAALVTAASNVMTLLPGDVLLAGAAGTGDVALECGDEVSVSIDGIGTLTNRVEKGD